MRERSFIPRMSRCARLRRPRPALLLTLLPLAAAALPACSDDGAAPARAAARTATVEARARVHALRAMFPRALGQAPAGSPLGETSALPRTASVTLPSHAAAGVRLRDEASGLAVTFSLEGARDVAAATVDGVTLYRQALVAGGAFADVLHRVHPAGTEDFVYFEREPPRRALRYRVDVTMAAGLRLVENTLEFLDAGGAPRLRVAPPYLVDAEGARHDAALSVEGCAVDTSPRAPWGRPPAAPGASTCTVTVGWDSAAVRYPALVDPLWMSTSNAMTDARARHTAVDMAPGAPASRVLIAGGFMTDGAALRSAEIYEPLSRTFARTGSLRAARGAHTATALGAITPSGDDVPVLIAGGAGSEGGTPLGTLEVYDPATGEFSTDPASMSQPRFNHTATLIANRTVLIAGGIAPPLNQPTSSALVYTFTDLGDTALVPTENQMGLSRHAHAAARLSTGDVLLCGGFVLTGAALSTAEIYNAAARSFGPVVAGPSSRPQMSALRGFHAATVLDSGDVLITGGTNQLLGGLYTNAVDLYVDGSSDPSRRGFAALPRYTAMNRARANHTTTLLPTGEVVIAGGYNGLATLGATEMYNPTSRRFTLLDVPEPMAARRDHTALLVNAGRSVDAGRAVLVVGGRGPSGALAADQALDTAQVLLKDNGEPCSMGGECLSGHCTEGVCCNVACTEECFSCTAEGKGTGGDGLCGFAREGTPLPQRCIPGDEIEVHNRCDGNGRARPDEETKDCNPGTCDKDGVACSPYCNEEQPCSETGWCDFTATGDASGAGGAGG
ncbi:Kelch repeat-containing protein, partial [Sorangium cellulosum]|uniref:Kelch repeat-containing protein n=1 Tax=Sorangium cellulosum TaxID=56 RepID=UPI0023DDFFD9